MSTSKKTKMVGTRVFIDKETQERVEMNVVEMEDRDFNFKKIWLGHVLEAVDEIGNAKMRVLMWLFDQCKARRDNTIITNQRKIANELGISVVTVNTTLKALLKADIITRGTGWYMVNPNVIYNGGHNGRMNVCLMYTSRAQEQRQDEE